MATTQSVKAASASLNCAMGATPSNRIPIGGSYNPTAVIADPVVLLVASEEIGGVFQNLVGGFNAIGTGSRKQVSRLQVRIGCSIHGLSFGGLYGML
jgi:hypothetical protein